MDEPNKIGVIADSFRAGLEENLLKAKQAGADGVQLYAVSGEMDPEKLQPSDRRALVRRLDELGLGLSALVGDFGGHGFQDAGENGRRIRQVKRVLELAADLGTPVVSTHIGIVPEEEGTPAYAAMQRACMELGLYAESLGLRLAVETGPEPAARLKAFLDSLGTKGIAVNYDPANLVMVMGDDPVQGVHTLREYIVHVHAKDGIRLRPVDPRQVYGAPGFNRNSLEVDRDFAIFGPHFLETPLGSGAVDWPSCLRALRSIGYEGYLTIEREDGVRPEVDIANAVRFLRVLMRS
ncbi:sugar phosphate isomerase/epimerase family protein [Gorillibacterium sp. CAU 1737]|uniref:sugar phosphate isomerase/epimerase family protein n=1 Tax=Gorillibacterium sp. CAU 1737 TaxID=3140362 RepID=UPI003261C7CE